jgi:hypothetical protein
MAEWLMAAVLKTVVPERVSGVRIPLPPPTFAHAFGLDTGEGLPAIAASRVGGLCVEPVIKKAAIAIESTPNSD